MSRTLIVVLLAAAILCGVGALEWYSRFAAGIASGGPVPLASIAPRAPLASNTPRVPRQLATAAAKPPASPVPSAAVHARTQTPVPSAGPKIVAVSLSSAVASGGQIVTGTVTTSPDVTSVQAGIAGYSSPLTKVSAGYFALSYRVPKLPAFLRRTYTIQVVAQNAKGQSVSSSLPITIR